MAVSPEPPTSPAHGVVFEVDPRLTPGYRVARWIVETVVQLWFRPHIVGAEHIPTEGPVLLAPVHRSFADFVFTSVVTDRKLFFMAKDSLWKSKLLGRVLVTFGVFPVHRESADREAMRRAEEVLARGELLVLFPEGTRQEGAEVAEIMEGASFLAARTGAVIVPMGIGGSAESMPKGTRIPKRLRIELVVGEPISPPEKGAAGRVSRRQVHATTEELRRQVQVVYDQARAQFQASR